MIYPYLGSSAAAADLTPNASNRVCNSLALLQCAMAMVVSDPNGWGPVLEASIRMYDRHMRIQSIHSKPIFEKLALGAVCCLSCYCFQLIPKKGLAILCSVKLIVQ